MRFWKFKVEIMFYRYRKEWVLQVEIWFNIEDIDVQLGQREMMQFRVVDKGQVQRAYSLCFRILVLFGNKNVFESLVVRNFYIFFLCFGRLC